MILQNSGRDRLPVLGPQFLVPGPYAPGSRVQMRLPLRNEGHQAERNVRLRWVSDGDGAVSIHPAEVEIDLIEPKAQLNIDATVTVLPDVSAAREVKVYAEIKGNTTGYLRTASAVMQIAAVARVSLDLDEHDVVVRNEGDAPTHVSLIFDPIPLDENGNRRIDCDDNGVVSVFALGPRSSRAFPVGTYSGIVSARTIDGERTVLRCDRVQQVTPHVDAQFVVTQPEEGARFGDLCPFTLELRNTTAVAAHDITLDITLPPGLQVQADLLTLNDVRVLAQDAQIESERAQVRCHRLQPNGSATLRGAFLIVADRHNEHDVLELDGYVTARGAERVRIRSGIVLDRKPQFSHNTTYLDEIEQLPSGKLRARCIVTNSELQDLQNASVNIRVVGARIVGVREFVGWDHEERQLPLQPSISDGPMTRVPLGTLMRDTRRELEITLDPIPTGDVHHHVGIAAMLLIDGYPIALGNHTRVITGRANLSQSRLSRRTIFTGTDQSNVDDPSLWVPDDSPLRLGMPVTINLELKNSGTVPAHDIRVAFQHPEQVEIQLPVEREGRWYRLVSHIPANLTAGLPITLNLIQPIEEREIEIVAEVDAHGTEPETLPPLRISTPAAPCVEISPVVITRAPANLLQIGVRVSNVGDGPANNVSICVPMEDFPLPRTTKIDDAPVQEEGAISPLVEGMTLGALLPGTYRDIEWMSAPGSSPYQAHVTVRYDGADEIRVTSPITTQHMRAGFATALPQARRIDTAHDTRPTLRPTGFTPSVRHSETDDVHDALGESHTKALGDFNAAMALAAASREAQPRHNVGEESVAAADAAAGAPSPQSAVPTPEPNAEVVRESGTAETLSSASADAAAGASAEPARNAGDTDVLAAQVREEDGEGAAGQATPAQEPAAPPPPPNPEDAIMAFFANKYANEPTNGESHSTAEETTSAQPAPNSDLSLRSNVDEHDEEHAGAAERRGLGAHNGSASGQEFEDDIDPHNRRGGTAVAPVPPPRTRTSGPNMELLTLMLPELLGTSLQGFKHVLALRALLPVDHPGYTTAETGLNDLLGQIISLGVDTRPDDPFVRRIEAMDSALLADVQEANAPIYEPLYAQLDAYLVRELPDVLEDADPRVAHAYHEYVDTLRFYWNSGANASWTNEERRANLASRPNMTLDQCLEALCDALTGVD